MRLIDADALKDALNEIFDTVEVLTFDDIIAIIDNAPTVDERQKGKWIIDGHHIRCNRCNEYMCNTDNECNKIPDNYCPNCGADMRKEEQNADKT